MALQFDIFGYLYDDSEPAFELLAGDDYYYHFPSKRLLEKNTLDAWMTANGKTFGANELGVPSAAYRASHTSIASQVGPGTQPGPAATGAAITASVTKVPTAAAGDTGQITVAGGPADKAYTVTVTSKDAASAADDVQQVAVARNDTAAQVATKIAAAIKDANLKAAAAGAVVTVTPKTGSTIAKLQVAVA